MPEDQSAGTASGRTPARLSLPIRAGWGLGTLGPVTVLTATNVVLLRYLTDFVGISAAIAASLIAFSRFFDAFADPAMGMLSDRTISRWGRRRPFLILGGAMLALAVVGMFAVPDFAAITPKVWYVGVLLIFYAAAYTAFNIPYMAMPAEMTDDYIERSDLMSYRVYAVGLSQIVASVFGPMLLGAFGGGASAYRVMALVFVPIILGSAIACFWLTRDAPATARLAGPAIPLGVRMRSVVSNKPFLVLILVKFLTLMALGVQSVYAFFFAHVLQLSDSFLGKFFLVSSLALIVSQPAWLWLLRKVGDKRAVYIIALLISIPAYLSWLWAGPNEPAMLIYVRAAFVGLSGGGAILMGQSLLPDTMEYDFRRTGLRREGVFAGFYTTVEKLSGAIGVAVVGAILGRAGYVATHGAAVVQPASAIHAIYLIMGFVPATISALGVIALLFYDLGEARLKGATLLL
jgi:GPH family glycoside/pentoside/hexuronide:cation symporter